MGRTVMCAIACTPSACADASAARMSPYFWVISANDASVLACAASSPTSAACLDAPSEARRSGAAPDACAARPPQAATPATAASTRTEAPEALPSLDAPRAARRRTRPPRRWG